MTLMYTIHAFSDKHSEIIESLFVWFFCFFLIIESEQFMLVTFLLLRGLTVSPR